jgi:hypothetical protein
MNRWIARVASAVVSLLVASIIVLVGIGYLCFALYLALLERMSAPIAAALTGLAALVLAALTVLAARVIAAALTAPRRSARRDKDGINSDEASKLATEIGRVLGKELVSRAHANPQATLVVSLLAIGAVPGLRRALREVLFKS